MTKLESMLKYVSEHNDFYKKRIKEYGIKDPLDITQWPVLTRKELQENRYNMFSSGYKTRYTNQELRRQVSSGSSGVPVNVYWDYKDWYASNMSLWRKRLQWYGIRPSERYVMFTLNSFDVKTDNDIVYYTKKYDNVLTVNASLLKNEKQYIELVRIINEFNPVWLYIQPFVLNRLINTYIRFELKKLKDLRYIESIGELLTEDLRKRAIDFFGVPVAGMYGSEEMNSIAYECPDHHMHVLQDNVIVEIQNENGICREGEGEAIITNLNNYGMPLIRYNQMDQILIDHEHANCQYCHSSQTIKLIKGRTSSVIVFNDNTEMNTLALCEVIAEVNNYYNDVITEYMYEYIQPDEKLICYLSVDQKRNGWINNIVETLKNTLMQKFPCITHFQVIQVSDMGQMRKKNEILKVVY